MDHEWGRNVTELGVGGTGATLAARRLGFPNIILTNAPGPVPGSRQAFLFYPDTDFPMTDAYYYYLGGATSFPGGWAVEPDGPV